MTNVYPSSLNDLKAHWQTWLYDHCLPLWEKSLDPRGGFFERLHQDTTPHDIDRRSRVAARQIYAYALAKDRGYEGQSDKMIKHGLSWLLGPCQRGNGYIYATLSPLAQWCVQTLISMIMSLCCWA